MHLSSLVISMFAAMPAIVAEQAGSDKREIWINTCDLETQFELECVDQGNDQDDLVCDPANAKQSGKHGRCDGNDIRWIGMLEVRANQKRRIRITKDEFKPYVCDVESWGWDQVDWQMWWNFEQSTFDRKTGDHTDRTDSPWQITVVCDRFPDPDDFAGAS